MRAKPKLDLGLSAYEELFMDANERAVQKLPRIYDIPIDLIDDFHGKHYRNLGYQPLLL